jgi:A/G-specific adenine glycosylase
MTEDRSEAGPRETAGVCETMGARLFGWYGHQRRELPWRLTTDPYRVLVSEVMLQQTQVARVKPAYHAFLEAFPDIRVLAAASTAEVLTAWGGLGYHRRARNLHRAAQAIVASHGGQVPATLAELRALPGVGEYTARAVLAFAHGRDAAPVDTNVARVLARAVAGRPLGRAEAQELADSLVPAGRGREWSAALMDLGAAYCTARAPRCELCPIASVCRWQTACRREGPLADPAATGAHRPRPQSRFAGSDRFYRGRLLEALRRGPVAEHELSEVVGLAEPPGRAQTASEAAGTYDARSTKEASLAGEGTTEETGAETLERVVAGLVGEGLAEWRGGSLTLPGASCAEGSERR